MSIKEFIKYINELFFSKQCLSGHDAMAEAMCKPRKKSKKK